MEFAKGIKKPIGKKREVIENSPVKDEGEECD